MEFIEAPAFTRHLSGYLERMPTEICRRNSEPILTWEI